MATETKYIAKKPDKNGVIHWTEEENETWSILYHRQMEIIKNRACDEFLEGLDIIKFNTDKVPQHLDVNLALKDNSGWKVKPVETLIPAQEFFDLLANKTFPAASFIRTREDLDYIQEPDIFHELFGHCPLLTNSDYAEFMERFGRLALKVAPKDRKVLFRLFWFTIEFGLIKTDKGLRVYGGGILSSINETVYSLESDIPKYQELDPLTALRTPYRIDIIQPLYFVIKEFKELYSLLDEAIIELLEESKKLGSFTPKFEPKEI
jgi:phenylalanine-4-hydroxylase